jgi:hypothetical protein
MKIDMSVSEDFKVARGARHIIMAFLAEDGDKVRAEKLLQEVALLLREGKEIPESTRYVIADHLERIASDEPLRFFNNKNTHRSENRSQKLETFFKVDELMASGKATSVLKAAEILSNTDTDYHARSLEVIKKDHERGKKLFQEHKHRLKNRLLPDAR